MCSWFLCFILTVSGFLPDDPSARTYRTRTDIGNEVFNNTGWITFPYPGQVVWPSLTFAAFFGMLAAVMASIVESLGDYNACAAICDVPTPPDHAINRGIAVEGLGGVLSCIWGTGTGTASYSAPIVIIGITKVASRRVVQGVGVFCIIVSFLQVICSFFATIPAPVLGGTLIVKTGMIISIGISLLQKVNLSSSRNLFVLGLALFFGIVMPEYLKQNPDAIKTGSPTVDSSLTVLLETGIFVGFVSGVPQERGLRQSSTSEETIEDGSEEDEEVAANCYDFPVGMSRIKRSRFADLIPVSPTFRGFGRRLADSHSTLK
ncbi:putative solute carrier family 23 member 1 isoform X3 [Apostichopus japonicus]|uniref:Putative solute carrier family 23 member 1 isoform X3 n=1 Tax=Stichopus japonicus TaxID=307972 RepID=A0A2G8K1K3_STIJA|nr:putative solute carrier family 23 member 1 isoform X3 [Apostichopus japonicus]